MQLYFNEAEGKILWLEKLAKKKKNYVERYSSDNNSKYLLPPSKRFKTADEFLKPTRGKSELLAAYPSRSNQKHHVALVKTTLNSRKAALWELAYALKKSEVELQILEEMHCADLVKDEKMCQERCEVLWKSLNNLKKICFKDVVALEKKMFNQLKNNKDKHARRGSKNLKTEHTHCEILFYIYHGPCFEKVLDFSVLMDEPWKRYKNHWRDLRWRISYQGKENEFTRAFTAHLEFIYWEKKNE